MTKQTVLSPLTRWQLLGSVVFLLLVLPIKLIGAAPPEKTTVNKKKTDQPNIVIIFTDDQGYQELGCFGAPKIKTPHIDKLAKEGMKFTSFYSAAPACSASRVGLLTGCYARRFNIPIVLFPNSSIGLHPQEITIADLLKSKGYRTACVGKWHLGDNLETFPTKQGFDSYYGIPYSNDMPTGKNCIVPPGVKPIKKRPDYYDWVWKTQNFKGVNSPLYENEKLVEQPVNQSTITDRYAKKAVEFIHNHKKNKKPFFLYFAHNMPHVPLAVPPRLHDPDIAKARALVMGHIDETVGKVVAAIEKIGQTKNTLIIFASDNGPPVGLKSHKIVATLLRGGKGTTYEGGQRVPCVMRWPAKIPAGKTCSQITSTIDLLPTIAKLVNEKLPKDRPVDGHDISALLSNPKALSPYHDDTNKHGFLYYRHMHLAPQAIRQGKWKLRFKELYNLETDIGETTNVAKQFPKVVAELTKLMKQQDAAIRATKRDAWRGKGIIPPKKRNKTKNK